MAMVGAALLSLTKHKRDRQDQTWAASWHTSALTTELQEVVVFQLEGSIASSHLKCRQRNQYCSKCVVLTTIMKIFDQQLKVCNPI